MKMTLEQRLKTMHEPVVHRLVNIMMEKKTNICVAADVSDFQTLLRVADKLGPKICCLKTHVDALDNWNPDTSAQSLVHLAREHNFLLFEDRKFADIGKTVEAQVHRGPYKISSWSDLITVHGLPGPRLLDSLDNAKCKALIVAEMSSEGNLATKDYAEKCTEMAKSHRNAVGLICQSRLDDALPSLIQMTPGVNIGNKTDQLGQQYSTPESAILERGADIIIVGRGILGSPEEEMLSKAEEYRRIGWETLLRRCNLP